VSKWRQFIDALRLHEAGHELDALNSAGRIADYLRASPTNPTCSGLAASIDAFGSKAIRSASAWDVHYDAVTDHGATQGAVWP
jgi:predicted secreted Zn-dependent protease